MTRVALGPKLLAVALVLSVTRPAWAVQRETCMDSAESAQELRKQHKLQSARDQLKICAQRGCPGFVRRDCTKWLKEVEHDMPTVVLRAHDDSGKELTDVRVLVDGTVVATSLESTSGPLEIDPGEHTFRFEAASGGAVDKQLTISPGEKKRAVEVEIAAPPKPAPPAAVKETPDVQKEDRPIPVSVFVAGGVGVVALGSFAFFAVSGASQYGSLEGSCRPHCTDDEVAPVKTKFLVANVSLAAAAVAFGVGAVLYVTRPSREGATAEVSIRAVEGGAAASFGAIF